MKNNIDKVEQKIQKLEREKKILSSSIQRKDRTRRLIQIGALSEKYFDLYHSDLEDIEEIFSQFSNLIKSNKLEKHKKNNES